MIAQAARLEITQPFSHEQRRIFHQLPLSEKRRRLAEQAERAVVYYEEAQAATEREEWQGGDLSVFSKCSRPADML